MIIESCSVNFHGDRRRRKEEKCVFIQRNCRVCCMLYVYLSQRERVFIRKRECVCERERESERERERKRERE